MRDSDNYELEYFSHNRSKCAKLGETYRAPGDFIGSSEKPKYFQGIAMKDLEILNPELAEEIINTIEGGTALEEQGAHDDALAAYEKAWSLMPDTKTEWVMLSNWLAGCFYESYFQKKDFRSALHWAGIERDTRESDIDVGPWMDLGKAYYELGDQESAFEHFKKAFDFGKARVFKEHPEKYYKFFRGR